MSGSESTTKARTARRIERQRIDAVNGRGSDRINQFEADLAALGGVSARLNGNQRRAKASAKGDDRRSERRCLAREARVELAAI